MNDTITNRLRVMLETLTDTLRQAVRRVSGTDMEALDETGELLRVMGYVQRVMLDTAHTKYPTCALEALKSLYRQLEQLCDDNKLMANTHGAHVSNVRTRVDEQAMTMLANIMEGVNQ